MNKTENDELVNRLSKYVRNGMPVDLFKEKFHINDSELMGIIQLFKINDKNISIIEKDKELYFKKSVMRGKGICKKDPDDLILTSFGLCSDPHIGNNNQQLHLYNWFAQECYNRGIGTIYNCGDTCDGNYTNRLEQPRLQFLHGFDEQISYVIDMFPKIKGMQTYYILGSHDETHYKNGQATANEWISRCRDDMIYLGQDHGMHVNNNMKIYLDHPGGGSSQYLSTKPQKRLEIIGSKVKPQIYAMGHYHKSYQFTYDNIRCISVPSLCFDTQFQNKQGLINTVGVYFVDVYSKPNGQIEYFDAEEVLFGEKDRWDEAGKDKNKVKQLVIK